MQTPDKEIFRQYTDEQTFERIKEFTTVSAMWEHCAREFKDAPAIVDEGKTRSYAELDADVAGFRALLGDCPVGTRVAIFAMGMPVDFEMKGTVREERGLTSIT